MTPTDQSRIQAEYDLFLATRKEEIAAKKHVDNSPATEESVFIITDKEV